MTSPIFDAVYSNQRAPVHRPWRIALLAALLIHTGVLVSASFSEPTLEVWAAGLALQLHNALGREEVVTLETPPPQKLPEPTPVRQTVRAAKKAGAAVVPARAAQVVARQEGPADLTDNTFVTGTATHYAGGATSPSGTSQTPVAEVQGTDRSESVRLSATDWSCPWPKEADRAQIDQQRVVIKVEVAADGAVYQASIVRDAPGGFGAAALACARRTRFDPARDRTGAAVRSWSPAIEVTFTR